MHSEWVNVYVQSHTVNAPGLKRVNRPVNTFTDCLGKHIKTRENKKRKKKRSFIGKVVLPFRHIIFANYRYL